ISRGVLAAVSTYESPNNHLLNTLLSWGSVKAFGNSPPSLRLPALLAGILCVAASMMLANRIAGFRAAILAGFLVALSSPLIEYSTNARGYTLLGLFTLLSWLSSVELARRENRIARWMLAAAIGLGIATIPLMVLPLLMLIVWIGCFVWKSNVRADLASRMLASLLGGGLIAFVFYSPILIVTGPVEFLANASGRKLGPQSLTESLRESIEQMFQLLFRDTPWPTLVLLLLGIVAFIWRLTPLFRFGRVTALLSTLACFIPLLLLNSLPPSRVWLFLLPLLLIAGSCGGTWFLQSIGVRWIRNLATIVLVAILAVWPFITTTTRDSIALSAETGAFPEAELILNDLRPMVGKSTRIYATGPSHAQLVYYGERIGIERHQFPNPDSAGIADGAFLICRHDSVDLLDRQLRSISSRLSRAQVSPLRTYGRVTVFRHRIAE
ncbi:MAG TPA: glycosyltransferase family 39 protein, partial [Planctomycetaceae bacterium]|nr:glycosyltransferase family 39 protein [Planctomycetaceae bacterium]